MKYIIKRNINLFGKNNIVKFEYDVKLNKTNNGFENFDIGNEESLIDSLLANLNDETISSLNKISPIYISLANYIFNNLTNLCGIEYETSDTVSKILRDDLSGFDINRV